MLCFPGSTHHIGLCVIPAVTIVSCGTLLAREDVYRRFHSPHALIDTLGRLACRDAALVRPIAA